MTIIIRLLVVYLVLFATAACTTTKPPAALAERIEDQFTAEELDNTRLVYVEGHDLVLRAPKRWLPRHKQLRESLNEVRLTFRDMSNRNAHGIIWILNAPKGSRKVWRWAQATLRNKTNSYSYASRSTPMKWQSVDIGEHFIHGWRTEVAALGNLRDMALLYAKKSVPQGPDKWLMVFIRNEGSYKPLDFEKDIKNIAAPFFRSFLDGPGDGVLVGE